MIEIGEYNELNVLRFEPDGAVLGGDENTPELLLPSIEVPKGTQVGDTVRVFLYNRSDGEPVPTTDKPAGVVGEFVRLKVVDVVPHGAFMDWGLEKDLLVPARAQHHTLDVGRWAVVAICLDLNGRLIGATKLGKLFDRDVSAVKVGQQVEVMVYGFNEVGIRVIVDDRYAGMMYRDDTFVNLREGDRHTGWVKAVDPDGRLDVTLRKGLRSKADEALGAVLRALDEEGGFLPLNDKSPPEQIRQRLQISKKMFKFAVGGLFRERRIEFVGRGIRLVTHTDQQD